MAEFNLDTPAQSEARWATYATALQRGTSAAEAMTRATQAAEDLNRAANVVKVADMPAADIPAPTPRPDPTPHITRIDRALVWLPLLVLAVVLVLLLAGCKDDRRPTSTASTTSQTQQTSGQTIEDSINKAVADAIGQPAAAQSTPAPSAASSDPWGGPVPTAVHYTSQCPGATNAEIDAAADQNHWVCYAATREAAK